MKRPDRGPIYIGALSPLCQIWRCAQYAADNAPNARGRDKGQDKARGTEKERKGNKQRHILDLWGRCSRVCRHAGAWRAQSPHFLSWNRLYRKDRDSEESLALSATVEKTTSSSVAISLEERKKGRKKIRAQRGLIM